MTDPYPQFRAAVGVLASGRPDLIGALAKAAEASLDLLRASLTGEGSLAPAQWREIARCLGVDLDAQIPAALTDVHVTALLANTRAKPSNPEMEQARVANMARLVHERGAASSLAHLLNIAPCIVSDLARGRRPFGARRARGLEQLLALEDGWFDRDDPVPTILHAQISSKPAKVEKSGSVAERARARILGLSPPHRAPPAAQGIPSGSLHDVVAAKFSELATSGKLTESFSYELLGKLLEVERSSTRGA